jgi:hypothetical protein
MGMSLSQNSCLCCNVDLQMQDGESALYIAVKNGYANVTKQLIATRCNVDVQPTIHLFRDGLMSEGHETKDMRPSRNSSLLIAATLMFRQILLPLRSTSQPKMGIRPSWIS